MHSNQSVSSPPNKTPKNKGKRAIEFGPFAPNMVTPNPKKTKNSNQHLLNDHSQSTKHTNTIHIISSSANDDNIYVDIHNEAVDFHLETRTAKKNKFGNNTIVKATSSKPNKHNLKGVITFRFEGRDYNDFNITLKSCNEGDGGKVFAVQTTDDSLRVARKLYTKQIDLDEDEIQLVKDGLVVDPLKAIGELGLRNGETLFVEGKEDPFVNTNSRYKMISIQETVVGNPMTLEIMAPLSMPIQRLYERWAAFTHGDVNEFSLVHNSKDIKNTNRSIVESKIKNGDTLYSRSKQTPTASENMTSDTN